MNTAHPHPKLGIASALNAMSANSRTSWPNVAAAGATVRAYASGMNVSSAVVPLAGATPGRAYVPGLLAGTYTVTVSLPGYVVQTLQGVTVTAENITTLNGGNTIVLVPIP